MYKNKYYNYKQKYLFLKKQIGGNLDNIKNISGPTNINYYNSPKYNKKIIVLGDLHYSKEGSCIDDLHTLNIVQYMDELFKINININLYIESDISDIKLLSNIDNIKKLIIKSPKDYIEEIYNFGLYNYNNPTKRIYFNDVRYTIMGYNDFYRFKDVLILLENIKEFKEQINLFEYFDNFTHNYTTSLFILYAYLNKISDLTIKPNLLPELLMEINKTNPAILDKIIPIINKYLINYFDDMLDKKEPIYLDNLDKINDIYRNGKYASAILSDMYTILHIMNNRDSVNNILYVGKAHIELINELLSVLDFELIKSINSIEPEIRCLKNIIPFHIFFNN